MEIELCDSDDGELNIQYYPPLVSRQIADWHIHLPPEMLSLMEEIYKAHNVNCTRLVMMGVRAMIDSFANEKVGDLGDFEKKLIALVEQKYISTNDYEILKAAVEMGHAVTHRGFAPDIRAVDQVLDILENFMQRYYLKMAAKEIKITIPPREYHNKNRKKQ